MDTELADLRRTVDDLLEAQCSPELVEQSEGTWSPELWQRFVDLGLTRAGVSEAVDGYGGGDDVAAAVARSAASHAAPTPLAETTMVAGWLRGQVGLDHGDDPAAVISPLDDGFDVRARDTASGVVISGVARAVPWGHVARDVLLVLEDPACVVSIPSEQLHFQRGRNIAGEPRDLVRFDDVPLSSATVVEVSAVRSLTDAVLLRGALTRSVMMAGALEAVLGMTMQYTGQREQFGRPIAQFQAVRQSLAVLAGHASLAQVASSAAVLHSDEPDSVMAARVMCARAASQGSRIAHQLFGTIGFTREHRLQQVTRRLWSWRDEGGSERYWSQRFGERLAQGTGHDLWAAVAGESQRNSA